MKYIQGNTQREYFVDGIVFPKRSYTDEELARGKSLVIEIEDEKYEELISKNPILKALIDRHDLTVREVAPKNPIPASAQSEIDDLYERLANKEAEVINLSEQLSKARLESSGAPETSDALEETTLANISLKAEIEKTHEELDEIEAQNKALQDKLDEHKKFYQDLVEHVQSGDNLEELTEFINRAG